MQKKHSEKGNTYRNLVAGLCAAGLLTAGGLSLASADDRAQQQISFSSHSEIESEIPDYMFLSGADQDFVRNSQFFVAETINATYWYIQRENGDHCLVAQPKVVEQLSVSCAPSDLIAENSLSLQLSRGKIGDLETAAFLLPDNMVTPAAESGIKLTAPNFVEVDGITDPESFRVEQTIHSDQGDMVLRVHDLDRSRS